MPEIVSPMAKIPDSMKTPPQHSMTISEDARGSSEPAKPVTTENSQCTGPIEAAIPPQTMSEVPETAKITNASSPPRPYGPLIPIDMTTPPNKKPRLMFDGHSPVLDALYFDAKSSLTSYDVVQIQ